MTVAASTSALQRLAQELKTFDWYYDPSKSDKANKASKRQEEKIKRIITKCKEEEVRELWDRVAPTTKFPTPFGLKPLKKAKADKSGKLKKGELPVHPTKVYERRKQLGLPDPAGELSTWDIECALIKAAGKHGCTIPQVVADPEKLKGAGLANVVIPERLVETTERDRQNYAANMLNVHSSTATRMLAEAVISGEVLIEDVLARYGEPFVRRIKSAIGELKDEAVRKQYEAAASRNGRSTDSTEAGATKKKGKKTMKTDKSNPTSKNANSNSQPRGSRYELFGQPATAVLRWMGSQGWDFAKARKAITALGFKELSDSTVRCQVGGWTYRGEPASLTTEQIAKVNEAGGGAAKASKASKANPKAEAKPEPAAKASPKANKAPSKAKVAQEQPAEAPAKAKAKKASQGPKQAPSEAKPTGKAKPAKGEPAAKKAKASK